MGVIVVGVDGSRGSHSAFEFALEEARLRNASLKVVNGWLIPLPVAVPGPIVVGVPVEYGPPLEEQLEQARASAERVIDEAIDRFPTEGVEVERCPVEGQATRALIESAAGADMIVVGSRGRGGFKGLVLGSVSQQLAHHAPCPVVIVRSPGADE